MIKSAVLKLSIYYVIIIMFISLTLSSILYSFSYAELKEDYSRSRSTALNLHSARDLTLSTNYFTHKSRQLLLIYVYFNLAILVVSFAISYLLASKTLKPLERNHQAQNRFIAQASHELRNPIAAMKVDTESILQSPNRTYEDLELTLKSNLQDLARLEKLSQHLLNLAKYQVVTKAIFQSHDIDKIIKDSIEQIKRSHINVRREIIYRGGKMKVQCDPTALELVLSIMIDNAIKYSYDKTAIEIKLIHTKGFIRLSVRNYGPLIAEKDIKYIFEPFYRVYDFKDNINGYGLGLSIAKQIMTMHDGKLEVAVNRERNFNEFYIELPKSQWPISKN